MDDLKLASNIAHDLICPICRSAGMKISESAYHCNNHEHPIRFPIIDGCPVLINEGNSVFAIEDFEARSVTTMDLRKWSEKQSTVAEKARQWVSRHTPSISRAVSDFFPTDALEQIQSSLGRTPKTLILGAGDRQIEAKGNDDFVYSDVAVGRLTQLVCDAHDIPFPDNYFDAVISASVLEHVADPYRCVDEIHRVLKPQGFVYAITPFMQQVHMGRYDFTRFTHLGHRRLFRRFTEERSGIANAQGMALAWAIERFIAGFADNPGTYTKLRSLARFIAFPFPLFDRILASKPGAYDSASAFYFFGQKSDQTLSDRDLVQGYRGLS